jgi:TonB family protein
MPAFPRDTALVRPPAPATSTMPVPHQADPGFRREKRPPGLDISGSYATGGGFSVRFDPIAPGIFRLTGSEALEGVGLVTGTEYRGVFRHALTGESVMATGLHVIDWSSVREPRVHTQYTGGRTGEFRQIWNREEPVVVTPPGSGEPKFGEYVYVEELPEAVTKVSPNYPPAAREAKVDGTVLIQALVLRDGTVGDVRVQKSIPELDQAAIAAVRQWRFKPALAKGQPVSVWVAVPVRFTVH